MKALNYLAVGLLLVAMIDARATAGTVTFGFEAEVTSLIEHTPFDTGLSVVLGDTIFGYFTFIPSESEEFSGFNQPEATAEFRIDGYTFATSSAGDGILFRVGNNAQISDGPSGLFDSILFGDGFDQLPDSSSIGISKAGWGINLTAPSQFALGSPAVDTGLPLPALMLPSDVKTWNLLANTHISPSGNHLGISMSDGESGSVSINAKITMFSQVPEPRSIIHAGIAVLAVACHCRFVSSNMP